MGFASLPARVKTTKMRCPSTFLVAWKEGACVFLVSPWGASEAPQRQRT